ncbi:MAG: alpha-mannosidase [Phycisphaerae bacterium]|nr:alpha-mannosidase [Phycisphaerae bacterium]
MQHTKLRRFAAAITLFSLATHALANNTDESVASTDTCMYFSVNNIVNSDDGNWFIYLQFSREPYTFKKGDHLEYDVALASDVPVAKGGIDIDFSAENLPQPFRAMPWARDQAIVDQDGIRLHGDGLIEKAVGKWHHRVMDMSSLDGVSVARWTVNFEGDKPGRYVQCIDNVRITNNGNTVLWVYQNGPIPAFEVRQVSGYSREALVTFCLRDEAGDREKLAAVEVRARRQHELRAEQERFRAELDIMRQLAERDKDAHLLEHVKEAENAEDLAAFERGDAEAYTASLHRARQSISHHHPQMQKYTGHLVGHAHIDLQWLWTWDETIREIIPQTFGQAVKFMEEFPDFTFSQSSAALYLATEVHHPELFDKMKKYIEDGRWELVGGRWCEGDTNIISPESHVRHFLYGQRYFQQTFGKVCSVGWEPDTFGHCWTMPQLLLKSGIDSYYFCRAGKGVPLFWWEGPDGSRVLAFEEPATGGWYNDVVSDDKVRELIKFVIGTGANDHLMVYGVGNHGGGPTREYIEAANAMKSRSPWPTVKFSTASEFFDRLHQMADKLNAPTIRNELNTIFEGCYTTHGRVKRLNRLAESALERAEVFSAMAVVDGAFDRNPTSALGDGWKDVLFNHHHDTLPGSFIHPPSFYTNDMLERVIAQAQRIQERSLKAIADRAAGGKSRRDDSTYQKGIWIFNPLAWARSEVVTVDLFHLAEEEVAGILDSDGRSAPMQILDRSEEGDTSVTQICFLASGLPSCGYKVFLADIRKAGEPHQRRPLPIHIGEIDGVRPHAAKKPSAMAANFQILHEKPGGMTAWTIQTVDQTQPLGEPVWTDVIESGPVRTRVRRTYRHDLSTLFVDEVTYAASPRVDYEVKVEWLQIGNSQKGSDMLKVAFDTGISNEEARSEIPFGDIGRPTDGKEYPTLKWVALSDGKRTVAVLNDCKHGYDVKDGVIRMTMLRSSYDPDPTPDVGIHLMRFGVMRFDGPLDRAALAKAAWEFNQPAPFVVRGAPSTDASIRTGRSYVGISEPNIIMTAFKAAEDGDGLILRAYECAGMKTQAKLTLGFAAALATETDLLERVIPEAGMLPIEGGAISAEFGPYEIKTIKITRDALARSQHD